jgi:hypothetical protein
MGFFDRLSTWRTTLGTSGTAEMADARSTLFPDFGLRGVNEQLSASFDPFNLAVRSAWDPNTAEERELLREGKFDALRHLTDAKMKDLDRETQASYILNITTEVHELRHYHEHFGTTFGFSRVWQTLQDGVEFYRLWNDLEKEPCIKLPLLKWGGATTRPRS